MSELHCLIQVRTGTAIAQTLNEMSPVLSQKIIWNPDIPVVFRSEFDNYDQIINTLAGMDFCHTADGIVLQEINEDDTEDVDSQQNASCKLKTDQLNAHEIPSLNLEKSKAIWEAHNPHRHLPPCMDMKWPGKTKRPGISDTFFGGCALCKRLPGGCH